MLGLVTPLHSRQEPDVLGRSPVGPPRPEVHWYRDLEPDGSQAHGYLRVQGPGHRVLQTFVLSVTSDPDRLRALQKNPRQETAGGSSWCATLSRRAAAVPRDASDAAMPRNPCRMGNQKSPEPTGYRTAECKSGARANRVGFVAGNRRPPEGGLLFCASLTFMSSSVHSN